MFTPWSDGMDLSANCQLNCVLIVLSQVAFANWFDFMSIMSEWTRAVTPSLTEALVQKTT